MEHISVLLQESIDNLNINPDGIYVDCTLGRGGHSSEILKRLSDKGLLISIDRDDEAIEKSQKRLSEIKPNFKIIKGNFDNLKALLAIEGIFEVDGILYDLGVSSPQFDEDNRGFSYRFDGPLDMRMDQSQDLTAEKVVNTYDEKELANIIYQYGDEKFSKQIAREIVKSRPIKSTLQLVDVIKKALPQKVLKLPKHPAKKTFQALRVYVNGEMDALEKSLRQALDVIKPHGRICIITFQSQEEKIVSKIVKEATTSPQQQVLKNLPVEVDDDGTKFKLISKKPIKPSKDELEQNRRAHSSKLWVIEKK
ncbi:16S rRNA (cytosine(1402)-N(4))-methyltransferase RsmH [Mesoplasma lactucae]|nr:16S rRNA (cytosine(1402)-N(4))-methyltransferase RsmH [Mesoplasma lactucae]ATZ20058.1 16S rRNA (cytosine1402-N4)-methyltransferase [Mesoplasma lactucae ATCC 49193]MCL8216806.1 Ribosomal RNA small subunit methyltransferase H [Mesoplasma lactucae ATCC 49193]